MGKDGTSRRGFLGLLGAVCGLALVKPKALIPEPKPEPKPIPRQAIASAASCSAFAGTFPICATACSYMTVYYVS